MHVLVSSVIVCLLLASSAFAQAIPIRGHWQKSVYNHPTEWPFLSAQAHWSPSNDHEATEGMLNPQLGHLHVECWAPIWGETTTAAFTVPCQLQLFHIDGVARVDYGGGEFVSRIVWQATSSETPPILVGNPHGVVVYSMQVTFDPKRRDGRSASNVRNIPDHGWWVARLWASAHLANGDSFSTELWMPFYSVINPNAPIPTDWSFQPELAARATVSSLGSTNNFGVHVSQYVALPPILAPVTTPVAVASQNFAYGLSEFLPPGTFRVILDPDLHNGKPGVTLSESMGFGHSTVSDMVPLDPVVMGSGRHKIAISWDQKTGTNTPGFARNRQLTSLLVLNVVVGEGFGSGSPPIPPVVQPPPAQRTVTPRRSHATLEELRAALRTCLRDRNCTSLGTLTR